MFQEPDNGSGLNRMWLELNCWFDEQKEGLVIRYHKSKDGVKAWWIWITYRIKF